MRKGALYVSVWRRPVYPCQLGPLPIDLYAWGSAMEQRAAIEHVWMDAAFRTFVGPLLGTLCEG